MQTETITLGEKEYTLHALPLRPRRVFVEFLMNRLGDVFDLVSVFDTLRNTSVSELGEASGLLQKSAALILNSPDIAADLLYAYSTDIAADKEYIEDTAIDTQVVDGFIAVGGLLFGFLAAGRGGQIAQTLRYLTSNKPPTGTNSVSVNGDSGQTNLTPLPETHSATPT